MRIILAVFILSFCFGKPVRAETFLNISSLCKTISKYDVHGADYVPGYDIDGNPVVPADLGPDLSALSDPIIIPITVDLKEVLGKAMPELADFQSNIANIKIYEGGRITYNGKNISKPLSELCSPYKPPENQEKIAAEAPKGNRQVPKDNVMSSDIIKGQYPDDEDKKPVYND